MNYKTIIFDMDGTLVDSKIDYTSLHAALNLDPSASIVNHLNSLNEKDKQAAHDIIHHFETTGYKKSVIIDGVKNLLNALEKNNINVAIFTLNSRVTAEKTLKMHDLKIPFIITREDAQPKPNPEGLFKICDHYSTPLDQALYVGDYIYDLQAGLNANIKTALYAPTAPDFDHSSAYIKFNHFDELHSYLFNFKK